MVQITDERTDIQSSVRSDNKCMQSGRYRYTYLTEENAKELYKRLLEIMEFKKIFLNPELTLNGLAEKMIINRNALSQLINQFSGFNYNDFINRYRIKEAQQIITASIQKKQFLKMWIISFEAGFNSKTVFYRVFKRFTGYTPYQYKSLVERTASE